MVDSVYVITFEDDSVHMVVSNKKFAEKYCEKNPQYDWECYSVQKNEVYA